MKKRIGYMGVLMIMLFFIAGCKQEYQKTVQFHDVEYRELFNITTTSIVEEDFDLIYTDVDRGVIIARSAHYSAGQLMFLMKSNPETAAVDATISAKVVDNRWVGIFSFSIEQLTESLLKRINQNIKEER